MEENANGVCVLLGNALPQLEFNVNTTKISNEIEYTFRHIFVKKGKSANVLEKKLAFFILVETHREALREETLRRLWEQIQANTCTWAEEIPPGQRENLDIRHQCNVVCLNGTSVEIRGGKLKTMSLLEWSKQKEEDRGTVVLVTDTNTFSEEEDRYFYLDENKEICVTFHGTTPCPFHASFDFSDPGSGSLCWGDVLRDTTRVQRPWHPSTVPLQTCVPRRFDCDTCKVFYVEGQALGCDETGATTDLVGKPCHEFKLFVDAVQESASRNSQDYLMKFVYEVLRFACGCLNTRTNGTIHFGVADEHVEESKKHKRNPREIVGVSVPDRVIYNDKLTEYIQKCFKAEDATAARMCIRAAEFVSVQTEQQCEKSVSPKYVIEVDVDPAFEVTKKTLFGIKLPKVGSKQPAYEEKVYYIRNGGATQKMTTDVVESVSTNLEKLDELRKSCEQRSHNRTAEMTAPVTRKLKRLLGIKREKLDDSYHRILVISKNSQHNLTPESLREKFSFLKDITWQAVIDFNNQGKTQDGLCKILTEDTRFDLHDAYDYEDRRLLKAAFDNPQWVFANGNDRKDAPLGWDEWQMSKQKRGLDKLIQQASEEFPPGRVVIFFLILPGVSDIETLAFGQFCSYFSPNQVMFYVEEDQTFEKWVGTAIKKYMYINEHTANRRGVVGLPWQELQEVIRQLTYGFQSGKVYIPISRETVGIVPTNQFNDRLITIFNVRECERLDTLSKEDEEAFVELAREEEERFYQGQAVTWANIWFTDRGFNHVLQRDCVSDLIECFHDRMEDTDEILFRQVWIIKLFYTRGSGGSTVAQQVLWRLCRETPYTYRGCLVRGIQDETVDEILRLYRTQNPSGIPVIALVEDTTDILFQDLVEKVTDHIANSRITEKVAVIFFYIKRSLNPEKEAKLNVDSFALDYQLGESEYELFKRKYNEMKKKYEVLYNDDFDTYADNNLITFMILMKPYEGRRDYIQRLVNQTFPELSERERDIAMYLSLLHIYDPYPVFLSCFDSLMIGTHLTKQKFIVNWTNDISRNLEKFLRQYDVSEHYGTGKAVAITHPGIAEAILDYLCRENSEDVGDIALRFLSSQVFMPMINLPAPMKHLHKTTNIILKQRKTDAKFSPLIEKILKQDLGSPTKSRMSRSVSKNDLDKAGVVLEKGLDIFQDPVLSQHLARLYYLHGSNLAKHADEYFSKAEEYAKKALESAPKNSFFMDTMGRIFKARLRVSFEDDRTSIALMEPDRCLQAVKLAFSARKWFVKSEEADRCGTGCNTAGYFGELSVMFYMLEVVSCCKVFRFCKDIEPLRNYLCDPTFIPSAIDAWPKDIHESMKSLRDRYFVCMAKVEESFSLFKEPESKYAEEDANSYTINKSKFIQYFLDPIEISSPGHEQDLLPSDKWSQNWHRINKYLMGHNFYNVFNIQQSLKMLREEDTSAVGKLKELKGLVEENLTLKNGYDANDVFCKITINMALHSPFKRRLNKRDAVEEYYQIQGYVQLLYENEERYDGYFKMYSLLLNMMFLWPHDAGDVNKSTKPRLGIFQAAAEQLKQQVQCRQYQRREEDAEIQLYHKMTIRKARSSHTTLFYLGKGWGLDAFVHVNELQLRKDKGRDQISWERQDIQRRLKRCFGIQVSEEKIEMDTDPEYGSIYVYVSKKGRRPTFTKERVSFFLGFSWSGPLALDIQRVECYMRPHLPTTIEDSDAEEYDGGFREDDFQTDKKKQLRLTNKLEKAETDEERQKIMQKLRKVQEKLSRDSRDERSTS